MGLDISVVTVLVKDGVFTHEHTREIQVNGEVVYDSLSNPDEFNGFMTALDIIGQPFLEREDILDWGEEL